MGTSGEVFVEGMRDFCYLGGWLFVNVGIFYVLRSFAEVCRMCREVLQQVSAVDLVSERDGIEVGQEEFCHGYAFGENSEKVFAIRRTVSEKIGVRVYGKSHEEGGFGVEFGSCFEEMRETFRRGERAFHLL